MVAVMSPFSGAAISRGWRGLEEFFNPCLAFERVIVVSLGDNHKYKSTQFGSVEVHPIPEWKTSNILRIPANILLMIRCVVLLERLIRRERVDLIAQTYGGPLKYGLPAVAVARRHKIPCLISLHNDYRRQMEWTYPRPLRWLATPAWRYLFRNAAAIRSVSHYIGSFPLEEGVPAERVRVIPNKENLQMFRGRPPAEKLHRVACAYQLDGLGDGSVIFLTVARLIEAKNLAAQISAFGRAAATRPNIFYLIAGDGPLRRDLVRLVAQLGLKDRVRFLGFIPHDELRCIYHLSDVFLFVTHYEGQPRAAVEAMLAGLPIICAKYGQICEIVANGVDGVWADPQDVSSIQTAIELLADDSGSRMNMSRHIRFDERLFSLERVSPQEAHLLLSIARQTSASCDSL